MKVLNTAEQKSAIEAFLTRGRGDFSLPCGDQVPEHDDLMSPSRIENAYPLGYLDSAYDEHCTWLVHREDDVITAVVLIFSGHARPGIFSSGDVGSIRPILRDAREHLPTVATAHIPTAHLSAIRSHYVDPSPLRRMRRMWLAAPNFHQQGPDDSHVVKLDHTDLPGVMALYGYWEDHFFDPYQLQSGLYFGVRADDNTLVSIAGIHNVSIPLNIASIGNLVTHPDFRGLGYARACTARLLKAVFQHVSLVTLDVEVGNQAAIRTYEHFGFQFGANLFEGEVTLKP